MDSSNHNSLNDTIVIGQPAHETAGSFDPTNLVQRIHTELFHILKQDGREKELDCIKMGEWTLIDQARAEETQLLEAYANVTGLPVFDEEEYSSIEQFPKTTFDFLSHHLCVPLSWDAENIDLLIAHPYDLGSLSLTWNSFYNLEPRFILGRRTVIERYINEIYDNNDENNELVFDENASEETLRDMAKEAPIVRLVNDMFSRAVETGASDIHVEPAENQLAIRFRIDGVLQTVLTPPISNYSAIASRIKLLAGVNIAEHRLPQDGRIDYKVGGVELDIRVSTVPSMHGESIVLRLLQKDVAVFDLQKNGMEADLEEKFSSLFSMPHGMILVVGPTGSGKTTTLYSVMKLLNSESRKIITIEDPVEYQLEGLTQIHVRSQIGLTFAAGLRSIVRQDPDVILVGEIRDRETAEIAIHAALTGHLVLSTLHTNDAAGAVSRLLDMGVESFLISSSLLCVLSQRLVRRVCTVCNGTGTTEDDSTKRCRNCHGSGYKGRLGIFELLTVNEELRKAINARKDSSELAEIGRRNGMKTLRENGEVKVQRGLTTQSEVARVCQMDLG